MSDLEILGASAATGAGAFAATAAEWGLLQQHPDTATMFVFMASAGVGVLMLGIATAQGVRLIRTAPAAPPAGRPAPGTGSRPPTHRARHAAFMARPIGRRPDDVDADLWPVRPGIYAAYERNGFGL